MDKIYIILVKSLLFFAITISLIYCDKNPTETQNLTYKSALSFIITSDSIRQKALFTYVNSVDKEYTNWANLIDSAGFFVNGRRFHNLLNPPAYKYHNRECYYNYYGDSLDLQYGDTIRLYIKIKDVTIIGSTIIPGKFIISAEGNTISWTKSANAFYYHITVKNKSRSFVWEGGTDKQNISIDANDLVGGFYNITVTSFDKNYNDYYQGKTTSAGINGAYGIFSAVNKQKIIAELY